MIRFNFIFFLLKINTQVHLYINFYMDKFIGADNAKYMKEIRVYDKNLYKDLMKKLSKQLDYMENQLKLYQQY
mgnify:CR=1 FL=1